MNLTPYHAKYIAHELTRRCASDAGSRDIDRLKDALLDDISRRLAQKTECEALFTLRWRLV